MQTNLAQTFHYLQFDEGSEENTPPLVNNTNSVTNDKLFTLLQGL